MKEQFKQGQSFVVFVDGMDGDVYPDWDTMTHGVTHAFEHGAEKVTIEKFPPDKKPTL